MLPLSTLNYQLALISFSDLRIRWEWHPLRNDPRFQKILAGPEPKTVRDDAQWPRFSRAVDQNVRCWDL